MVNLSLMTPDSIGILRVAPGLDNVCPWNFSFVFFYQCWLYLFNVFFMTSDLIGIFVVTQMALSICAWTLSFWPFLSELVVAG